MNTGLPMGLPVQIRLPTSAPQLPELMSLSVLRKIEQCPRRWYLETASYPWVWPRDGYPERFSLAQIRGRIVHQSIRQILRALPAGDEAQCGCGDIHDLLRRMGGLSSIVLVQIERQLLAMSTNPRMAAVEEEARRLLLRNRSKIRESIQTLLGGYSMSTTRSAVTASSKRRDPMRTGSTPREGAFSEHRVTCRDLGWVGVLDRIVYDHEACEITEFKTSEATAEHIEQLETYCLLWLHAMRKPLDWASRVTLILRHKHGVVKIESPSTDRLRELQADLLHRSAVARGKVAQPLPESNPAGTGCSFCSVRHMCAPYWGSDLMKLQCEGPPNGEYQDTELRLLSQLAPTLWRTERLMYQDSEPREESLSLHRDIPELRRGQTIRVIDALARRSPSEADSRTEWRTSCWSEVFTLPESNFDKK